MSERTIARLEKIQAHLRDGPKGGRLEGKVAIITGVGDAVASGAEGNWNIGSACAWSFAREGAKHLYLVDFASNLENLSNAIQDRFPQCKVDHFKADAADEEFIKSLCQRAIDEENRLDIFYANAGISGGLSVPKNATVANMENVHRVNTVSCLLAIKYASEAMKVLDPKSGKTDTSGSIICTASVAGIRSGAGGIDYSASKAAVINLCQTSANMLVDTHIRVNAVCPGLIETGMTKPTFTRARAKGSIKKVGQLNPMRRFGIPEEIAQGVLFLASDEASYVNGIHFPIDGGLSSSHPIVPGHIV